MLTSGTISKNEIKKLLKLWYGLPEIDKMRLFGVSSSDFLQAHKFRQLCDCCSQFLLIFIYNETSFFHLK